MLEPRKGCYAVDWWHIEAKRQALEGGTVDEMVSWFYASTTIAFTGTATHLEITHTFDKPLIIGSSTHVHSMVITIITYHTTLVSTRHSRYNFGAPLFSVIFLTAASPLAPPT